MTQVISLFSLPPEILGLIISWINDDIVRTVENLTMICSNARNYLISAIQYVDSVVISFDKAHSMIRLFTGVRSLKMDTIENVQYLNEWCIPIFDMLKSETWSNLVHL